MAKKKIISFALWLLCLSITSLYVYALNEVSKILLQDVKVQINSEAQLKVTLVFNVAEGVPKATINKENGELNLDFTNSYVVLDNNNIQINHQLLKDVKFIHKKNDLRLVFSVHPDALFTLNQDKNIYTLTFMAKDKVSELMAAEQETNADNKNGLTSNDQNIVENSDSRQDIGASNKSNSIDNEIDKMTVELEKIVKDAQTAKETVPESVQATKELKSSDVVKQDKQQQSIDKQGIASQKTNKKSNEKIRVATEPQKFSKEASGMIKVKSTMRDIFNVGEIKISDFEFKLSDERAGQIIIKFPDKNVVMVTDNSKQKGNNILQLKFKNTTIPKRLIQKYDVKAFGTVVDSIEWVEDKRSNSLLLNVYNKSKADYIAFQKGSNLVVEIKDGASNVGSVFNKTYSGKKISLNFQNIELRSVLQIIADFTDLNLVASDNIQGNISLRLMNVPWDQALDIILKTKSLDKRQFGNILMIAPTNEIFELEKAELESEQLLQKLAKLETAYFSINYAKAEDVAQLISGKNKILSERGTASFDKRTNLLIIQDTVVKINEIKTVLQKLDSPVKQVLIEARIVRADTNFRKELGIRWGLSAKRSSNNYRIGVGDTSPNATQVLTDGTVVSPKKQEELEDSPGDTGFNIDLGLADPSSIIGLALAKLPGKTLVHLELAALESEGMLETVSSPKLITANKVPARIEQGTEIPYQESTSSGATNIAFKKAVLSLTVTPQITPDKNIILDINVTNDTPNFANTVSNGVPVIDTQEVETQVLVEDSQTIVLGGIFTQTTNNSVERVPFLGDLPFVGHLFRNNVTRDDRSEFLIFITPKIVIDKA